MRMEEQAEDAQDAQAGAIPLYMIIDGGARNHRATLLIEGAAPFLEGC